MSSGDVLSRRPRPALRGHVRIRRAGCRSTFPHVLSMPLHLKIFALGAFPLRPMGLIHLSNTIESPGELRRERASTSPWRLATTSAPTRASLSTWIRRLERRADAVEGDLRVPGALAGVLARAGGRPPRPPKAPKDSAVLAEFDVTRRTAWAYARVSMDFNPIHLSDRAAKFFGLRGSIGHGMWSLARTLAQAPAPAIPGGAGSGRSFCRRCSCRVASRSRSGATRASAAAPCATCAPDAFTCTSGGRPTSRRRERPGHRPGHRPAHRLVSTDARTHHQAGTRRRRSRGAGGSPRPLPASAARRGRPSLRLSLPGRARRSRGTVTTAARGRPCRAGR